MERRTADRIAGLHLPEYVEKLLNDARAVILPRTREELLKLAMGGSDQLQFQVAYEVEGKGSIQEATVTKCKNGIVVNYMDDYMRRRDPDCLVVADDRDTDKPRFRDLYHYDFEELRRCTYEWLKKQELIVFPFKSGGRE